MAKSRNINHHTHEQQSARQELKHEDVSRNVALAVRIKVKHE